MVEFNDYSNELTSDEEQQVDTWRGELLALISEANSAGFHPQNRIVQGARETLALLNELATDGIASNGMDMSTALAHVENQKKELQSLLKTR